MKKVLLTFLSVIGFSAMAYAGGTSMPTPILIPTGVIVSSVSAAGGQAQITISTPTGIGVYSSGYYTYLTNVHIEMYATGTLTGGATPVYCTSTGITNTPQWGFPTAAATGTNTVTDIQFSNPLQGVQATNVVITCPATASVRWDIQAVYFQAS